jgi:hypothetical protein
MAMTAMSPTVIPVMKKALTMAATDPFLTATGRAAGNESRSRRSG